MDAYDPMLAEMLRMPDGLDAGTYRRQYQEVGFIAHGWLRRCSRGVGALIALHDAGYAGESPPLVRSVLEHSVALRWLIADGAEILGPLKTDHGRSAAKVRDAFRLSAGEIDEDHYAAVIDSVEHQDRSRDFLQQFRHRLDRVGNHEDSTVYLAETMYSHATYQSAATYWDFAASGPLTSVRDASDYREFAASYLYIALHSYNQLFIARPWTARLVDLRRRLAAIDPELDRVLPNS